VQTSADALEYFPAAQRAVTAVSPSEAQYAPAVQALQALKPVVAAKVPESQLSQLDDVVVDE